MSTTTSTQLRPTPKALWLVGLLLLVSGLAKMASLWTVTSGFIVYHEGTSPGDLWTTVLGLVEILIAVLVFARRLQFVAPALASLLFAGYAVAFHRFWEFDIEFQFAQQLLFVKNGLLAAVFMTLAELQRSR